MLKSPISVFHPPGNTDRYQPHMPGDVGSIDSGAPPDEAPGGDGTEPNSFRDLHGTEAQTGQGRDVHFPGGL